MSRRNVTNVTREEEDPPPAPPYGGRGETAVWNVRRTKGRRVVIPDDQERRGEEEPPLHLPTVGGEKQRCVM